jgi:hypothetical protein
MEPKEENTALAPQPRIPQRLLAVRADAPPVRTIYRAAARIFSLVMLTGLAIVYVPK